MPSVRDPQRPAGQARDHPLGDELDRVQILDGAAVVVVLAELLHLASGGWSPRTALVMLGTAPLLVAPPLLARRTGHVRLASTLLLSGLALVCTASVAAHGLGVLQALCLAALPPLAMILLGSHAALGTSAGVAVVCIGVAELQGAGALPGSTATTFADTVGIVLAGLLLVGLIRLREHGLERAWAQASDEEQRRLAAEDASESKSVFLATVSHELRTPMTGVLGTIDLLRQSELDGQSAEWVDILHRSATGLLTLLDDLLDAARHQAGVLELEREAFDVSQLIRETTELFLPNAHERGIRLVWDLDEVGAMWVIGDPARIRQILMNLLGNALKFTGDGTIEVQVRRIAGNVVIDVRDTGVGIPESRLDDIFEPFVQGDDGRSRAFGGAGLGLAITRGLVERMGGRIGVHSVLGEGSTFTVSLPLPEASDSMVERTRTHGRREARARRNLQILVAEDNKVNQVVVQHMLERLGHMVTVVDDGAAAVDAARSHPFELVLMDVMMPIMDGPTAARVLRSDPTTARLPIVALTADASDENRDRVLAAGMDDFVPKPIELARLETTIQRYAWGRQGLSRPDTPPRPPHLGPA